MNKQEFALELERGATEEARDQRNAAVEALREIYRLRGEDPDISRIANAVLDKDWVELI